MTDDFNDNVQPDEPIMTAELQIERRLDFIVRELAEIAKMASHAETVDLIEQQKPSIGAAMRLLQITAGLLLARTPRMKHAA